MFIGVISIFSYKFISKEYKEEINKKYEDEIKNMSKEDLKVVNEVISLAKDREGQEYTWGGKGEIVTKERLKELIDCYGESYYPLDKKDYIGKQGFDCSGLTYWTYKTVTGVNIVMYMGRGKIIHSASRNPYPIGGIKTGSIKYFTTGQVYRPISYINLVKTKK